MLRVALIFIMTFRLQAKHISLTYPRADFALEDGLAALRNKSSGSRRVTYVLISSETHEDGGLHRHAYVRFNARVNLANDRFFDFGTHHPNIQAVQNIQAWVNYVKKDGTFLEWTTEQGSGSLFENAETMDESTFFQWAVDNRVGYGYAQRAWDASRRVVNELTFDENNNPFVNLNLVPTRELGEFDLSTSLTNVIVGPTGCGKTVYCFRHLLKPMLLVSHIDDLKHFDVKTHRSVLFDDMKFDHMPIQAQIHLCDRGLPRSIHRRYGTTLIPAGIQIAITCNERPFAYHPAIQRRCHSLIIND